MKLKIGLIQAKCERNRDANLSKTIANIRDAASKGANIVCLQELFASLYFCDVEDYANFDLAEPIPSHTTDKLCSVAKELGIVIVASLFEKRAEGLYHNTAAVIDADGSLLGIYRKMHIPDDPGYYEKFYFTPGDLGYKTFKTAFGTIGVLICWDQWYPEASRITALSGAEVIFYPTAIGWALNQSEETNVEQFNAWQTIQRSHAVANGVHTVSVNRTGIEGEMQFWGGSFVCNPFGSVLHQSPHLEEENAVVEIETAKTDYYRKHWPFLRDRRIDSYGDIKKRFIDNR
ncbi:MAG: carbon-nitrogen hydrolase [Bacteroidales bacterium]|jgi:N-carbamoylputrescine amidase|nr:carbon-nitrogen hydrolase [Bacteroidales bacterium]